MCASVSLSGAIIDWILVTSLLSREVGARKEEEEEQEEQEGEEENETRLGGRPLLGRRLEKKRKRVASLHRCRFRALPLGATFAPGTAYANGKPGASRRRYSTSADQFLRLGRALSGGRCLFDYTVIIDGISQCRVMKFI